MVKSLPAVQETQVQSLAWEDPLEKEMATYSSVFAWKIPWTEEPGSLQSMGSLIFWKKKGFKMNFEKYYSSSFWLNQCNGYFYRLYTDHNSITLEEIESENVELER